MSDMVGMTDVLAEFVTTSQDGGGRDIAVVRAVVDTLGCGAASTVTPEWRAVAGTVGRERVDGGALVWEDWRPVVPTEAALLNGTAVHMLELDDAAPSALLHPSAVIVPALFAAAALRQARWPEFRDAYSVGAACARAIVAALPGDVHYGRGWHSTATVGALASACAVARLWRLSQLEVSRAVGIAASLAGGLRVNFGSATKALQVGCASRNGVLAAQLAAAGLDTGEDVLGAELGFFNVYGDVDHRDVDSFESSLWAWWKRWVEDATIKRYPCCYAAHRALDALFRVRSEGFLTGQVDRVTITVHPGGLRPLLKCPPRTGRESRFSLEYVAALAMADGEVSMASFEDRKLGDREIWDLAGLVQVAESERPPVGAASWQAGYAVVDVVLRDGSRRVERCDVTRGNGKDPLTWEELMRKCDDCISYAGLGWRVRDDIETAVLDDGYITERRFVRDC